MDIRGWISGSREERERNEGYFSDLMNRQVGEGGRLSWGLVILFAFAAYAVVRLAVVIAKFF